MLFSCPPVYLSVFVRGVGGESGMLFSCLSVCMSVCPFSFWSLRGGGYLISIAYWQFFACKRDNTESPI